MNRVTDFFKDKEGNIVIAEAPNAPLWVWIFLSIFARILDGPLSNAAALGASVSLMYWAFLEITSGDSPFRKLLGYVVMVFVLLGFLQRLGS